MPRAKPAFQPAADQMALWPAVSGNAINGLGEVAPARPRPIYWHDPDATPHGPLQRWFQARFADEPLLAQARAGRAAVAAQPLAPLAAIPAERTAREWTERVKACARQEGAELVGVTRVRPEWVFEGMEVPQRWIVMLGVAHDYEQIRTAPRIPAAAEVIRQYGRGNRIARAVASLLRQDGHEAVPHGGPLAGPLVLIPPALACGFGELGKHGSIINRELGSSFRLACVLTDVPLVADDEDAFGADGFCARCRLCADACPPDAILPAKQLVRGTVKWYVDFDRCLPYFNESAGCAVCIAVCPWSRPGVAPRLAGRLDPRVAPR
jgi:epoxyqueuosine reductase